MSQKQGLPTHCASCSVKDSSPRFLTLAEHGIYTNLQPHVGPLHIFYWHHLTIAISWAIPGYRNEQLLLSVNTCSTKGRPIPFFCLVQHVSWASMSEGSMDLNIFSNSIHDALQSPSIDNWLRVCKGSLPVWAWFLLFQMAVFTALTHMLFSKRYLPWRSQSGMGCTFLPAWLRQVGPSFAPVCAGLQGPTKVLESPMNRRFHHETVVSHAFQDWLSLSAN